VPATPFVYAVGAQSSGTGAVTPAIPAGTVAGDVLVLFCETENSAVPAVTDYAEVTGSPVSVATGTVTRLTVRWHRATGPESGTVTVPDAGDHAVARIVGVRGCITSGDPWDGGVASGTELVADTSVSIPGATTTVPNCLVLAAVATGANVTDTAHVTGWANVDLANVTERCDDWNTAGLGGGFGVASGEKLLAGTYGNTTATLVTANFKALLSLALRPPIEVGSVSTVIHPGRGPFYAGARFSKSPRSTQPLSTASAGPITRRTLGGFAAGSGASSVTSFSVTPTGQVQGDWLLAFVSTVGGTATHTNSVGGFTEIGTQVTQAATTTVSLWKKLAGVGEAGPYTFDVATGRRFAIIVTAWTGADPADLVDGVNVSSEGATGQQLDHNSLTPGAAFNWHILGTASNTATPDDAVVTFNPPAGYIELAEVWSAHTASANARASLAARELLDTAATGVQPVTINGGVDRSLAGFEVVIRVPTGVVTPERVPALASQYGGYY